MCTGKVMGGMAALISERLPADKANGCGEAWASALLRNKHFHFVWLEWRMERWKWWIDDLRSSGGKEGAREGRWMEWMWMLFNINRSIREWWNMHFVNSIPHLAIEATLWSCDSVGCGSVSEYKILTAYSLWFVSWCWIHIAPNNNNPVVYHEKWIYIFMTLSSDDFMIIISELLLESMMRKAQLLQFAAYGAEKQRFNQITRCHVIICVARICCRAI